MRKILIVLGLLAAGALLTGSPAKAWVGCSCVKLGAPAACVAGPADCTLKGGGVCVLPCDYQAPKKAVKHHAKKRHAKKHTVKKHPAKKHTVKKHPAKKHTGKKSTKKKKM
jgi:hypothetical protein